MVKNCILFLLLLVAVRSIGQNNYLDDIQLMDNYRTKQLLGNTKDSNLVKDLSFMIRSTFGFQHLYYNSENNNSTIPDTNSFLSKLKQKSLQSQINSNSISHNTNDIIQLKDEIQLLKSGQDKIISLLHTLLHSNITTDLEK